MTLQPFPNITIRSDHRMEGNPTFPTGIFIADEFTPIRMSLQSYKPGCDCGACEDFRMEPNLLTEFEDHRYALHVLSVLNPHQLEDLAPGFQELRGDPESFRKNRWPNFFVVGKMLRPGWVAQSQGAVAVLWE